MRTICLLTLIFSVALSEKSPNFVKARNRAEKSAKIPSSFRPEPEYGTHRNVSSAVFAVAFGTLMGTYTRSFAGTLRKAGFEGDIVFALESPLEMTKKLAKYYNVIIYEPKVEKGPPIGHVQSFRFVDSTMPHLPAAMIRYFYYLWWAKMYESHTVILLADLFDVVFQSNPFVYMKSDWAPPVSDLVVFIESLPRKVHHLCFSNLLFKILCSCFL